MTDPRPKIVTVVGPTASGKTNLARFLAERFNGELISADSRQIYRRLDIGTGKEKDIAHHLVDIIEPMEKYTVADWQRDALATIDDVLKRGKLPIIVGGTGLYVSALLEGYDFSQEAERNPDNPRHSAGNYKKNPPEWEVLELGIDLPREELYHRIDQRVDDRIKQGMVGEVQSLLSSGVSAQWLRSIGLEYRFMVDLLESQLTKEEFREQLKFAIHQFARRQLAWWRHHGSVAWIADQDEAESLVSSFLDSSN